jgi:flagellar assembly factor FliW
LRIINTSFGEIKYADEHIIEFPCGILGFPESKKYLLIKHNDKSDFKWLQSLDQPELTFIAIDPYSFMSSYKPNLTEDVFTDLDIVNVEDLALLSLVTIPDNPKEMTANLKGPIVINALTKRGKQIIVDDEKYSTKHYILIEMLKDKARGQEGV